MTASLPETPRRVRAVTRTVRIVIALGTLAVLTQAVLAGLIFSGNPGALKVHGVVATLVALISLLQLVLAVIAWRRESASGRLAVMCAVVLLAVAAQAAAGVTGALAVHVPLGVALFGGYVFLLREVGR